MVFLTDMQHKQNELNFNEIIYNIELLRLHSSILLQSRSLRPIADQFLHPTELNQP